ncbi:hypothetical protein CSV75_01755 [Sporosarcina sp. P18a]|uniref:hypothetical protein n=1 Tax=Sporosarcina sp. P18a TaxID=2048259 RepID=UPI000C1665B0|nr:hypothetical protein [Sporosarcina sp. P18a]PIC80541.1 hypothetical protein CSV75_01755 [Sporosarcina sp. P18a]
MTIKEEKEEVLPKVKSKQALIEEVKETSAAVQDVSIYVGPTSKLLTRYASFTGGLPTHISEHFEKCKSLQKMFIPTSKFIEFEQSLKDPSSAETMLFNKVRDYFTGEVKML